MAKKISKKQAAEQLAKAVKKRIEEPDEKEVPGPHTARARFRYNLKKIREHAGYSQNQLGLVVDMSSVHICLMESGRRCPSIEMLDRLSEALKVDPREFLKEIPK